MVRPSRAVTRSRSCSAALRERQREDLVGAGALVDAAHDRLDQRRGLAGAGAGQDEQRPAGWSTTRCWCSSSVGTSVATCGRTRRYVVGELMALLNHPAPTLS